jgi:hypothetical protein
MPVGNGRGLKTMGRQLKEMAHIKQSIVTVSAKKNCLGNAIIIGIEYVDNDPNYKPYWQSDKILPEVDRLLRATGINLNKGGGLSELENFTVLS